MHTDNTLLQNTQHLQHSIAGVTGTTIQLPTGATIHIDTHNDVWMAEGESLYPLSHPAGEALIAASNRRIIKYAPRAICIGLAIAAFFVASVWGLDTYPATQEVVLAIHSTIAMWSVRLFGVVFTILFGYILVTVVVSGKKQERTTNYAMFIKQGLCLIASRTEDDETVLARLEQAQAMMAANQGAIKAILFLKFQDPIGYFWNSEAPDRQPQFDRSEGSRKWELPEAFKNKTFAGETWEEFEAYTSAIEPLLRNQWLKSRHQKGNSAANTMETLGNIIQPAAVVIFLFFCSALYGQKAVQVEQYLGATRFNHAAPVGKIEYVFEKAILSRSSDGKFTHKELLPEGAYYNPASNAGKLIAITVNNQPIAPAPAATATTTPAPSSDPVRPRPLFPENSGMRPAPSVFGMIPDSSTFAGDVEDFKQQYTLSTNKIKKFFGIAWDGIMWFFWSLFIILLLILGVARFIAKAAANESLINLKGKTIVGRGIVSLQQNSAGVAFIVAIIIMVVLLINIFITIVHFGLPLWIIVVLWFTALAFAEKITDWLVPNLKIAKEKYQ